MKKLLLIAPLLCGLTLHAENWPQWRGPNGNSVSGESGLPVQWSPEKNVRWKLALPAWSGSTPVIWGEHLFLNVADGDSLFLWSVNRDTGEVIWKRHLGDGNVKMRKQNMSSPSPVTDGESVWIMTGTGVLKAFDFSGNEKWSRNIQDDYGAFGLNWGYASSPLLHKGCLFVQVLHGMKTDDPSYVLSIDAASGKTLWRVERPTDAPMESPDSYTTPVLLERAGGEQIVISGGDYVTGHDPESGRELWRQGGLNPQKNRFYRIVASPTVSKDWIYVPTRVKPLQAFRVEGSEVRRVWSTEDGPDVPTPVTDGHSFWVINDKGVAWRLDAHTGDVIWGPERLRPGTYSSSPVLADGKLYISSEEGVTSVIAAQEFSILAENDMEGYTLSSLAISAGRLFLRTADYLYCVGTE